MRLFLCGLETDRLRQTGALEYIRWGEKQGYHLRSTCRARRRWYDLGQPPLPKAAWPRTFFERHICYQLPANTYCSDRLYGVGGTGLNPSVLAFLNSTYTALLVETDGYHVNHGGIDTSVWWLKTVPVLPVRNCEVEEAFAKLCTRGIDLARLELSDPNRRQLDEVVLSVLGLPTSLVDDLYSEVLKMVETRIHKARRKLTVSGQNQ